MAASVLRTVSCCIMAAAVMALFAEQALCQKRYALVIGNAAYPDRPLRNSVNDAKLVAEKLEQAGFSVTSATDLASRQAFESTVSAFATQTVSRGSVAMVYYAGHGGSYDGDMYLYGLDFRLNGTASASERAYSVDALIRKLDESGASVKILVLDACREPLTRGGGRGGFQPVELGAQTTGWYIAYAAAKGMTALDGDGGDNGPFAAGLAKYLLVSGIDIDQMFRKVRNDVLQQTRGQQVPWAENCLVGSSFYLVGEGADTSSASDTDSVRDFIRHCWLASQNSADFSAYSGCFSDDFFGVRRTEKPSGEIEVFRFYTLDDWLSDRRGMFKRADQGFPMYVKMDNLRVEDTGQETWEVRFTQVWGQKNYCDQGPKIIKVQRRSGGYRIVYEEMQQTQKKPVDFCR